MAITDQLAVKAQTYRLRTALLSHGRTHDILASTTGDGHAMNVAIKCYASGGENVFHTHLGEDHTFVVLQGGARFQQPGEPDAVLGRNEGILLPGGAAYKFEAVGDEPLVLLRVGNKYQARERGERDQSFRRALDGSVLAGESKENKHEEGVPIPGAYYE